MIYPRLWKIFSQKFRFQLKLLSLLLKNETSEKILQHLILLLWFLLNPCITQIKGVNEEKNLFAWRFSKFKIVPSVSMPCTKFFASGFDFIVSLFWRTANQQRKTIARNQEWKLRPAIVSIHFSTHLGRWVSIIEFRALKKKVRPYKPNVLCFISSQQFRLLNWTFSSYKQTSAVTRTDERSSVMLTENRTFG